MSYAHYMADILKELAYQRHLDELAKSAKSEDRAFVAIKREHEMFPRFFGDRPILHRGSKRNVLSSVATMK